MERGTDIRRWTWSFAGAGVVAVVGGLGVALWLGTGQSVPVEPDPLPDAEHAGTRDEGPRYSPFIVRVDAMNRSLPFDVISFKDVGMSVPEQSRAYVYESIAQSLSRQLSSGDALPMTTSVRYSEAIADPTAHRACEGRHIYVDLWNHASSEHWGYSMWSGCGRDSRFARNEHLHGGGDAWASVRPLTRDIAARLREAVRTGCFTTRC